MEHDHPARQYGAAAECQKQEDQVTIARHSAPASADFVLLDSERK
jgi:hypothetical protein